MEVSATPADDHPHSPQSKSAVGATLIRPTEELSDGERNVSSGLHSTRDSSQLPSNTTMKSTNQTRVYDFSDEFGSLEGETEEKDIFATIIEFVKEHPLEVALSGVIATFSIATVVTVIRSI